MRPKRKEAMEWWNTLSSAGKTRICDLHTEILGIRRWETLTGREIEKVWESYNFTGSENPGMPYSVESSDEMVMFSDRRGTQRSPFGPGS